MSPPFKLLNSTPIVLAILFSQSENMLPSSLLMSDKLCVNEAYSDVDIDTYCFMPSAAFSQSLSAHWCGCLAARLRAPAL